jgi:hypothetical protein
MAVCNVISVGCSPSAKAVRNQKLSTKNHGYHHLTYHANGPVRGAMYMSSPEPLHMRSIQTNQLDYSATILFPVWTLGPGKAKAAPSVPIFTKH